MEPEKIKYPTPKTCGIVFVLSLLLVVFIGSILQYYTFLLGLYITEWLLILGPPLIFLWRKVDVKKALTLHLKGTDILFGVLGGASIYFIVFGLFLITENVLGPYPSVEFMEKAYPTTWIHFIPWVLGIGVSAGICEEILFRGFIQNGLQTHWGPTKAVIVTALLFTVFHVDPWRTPSVIVLGLWIGYMAVRTKSVYTAIILHTTSNSLGQILAFTDKLPQTPAQWGILLAISVILLVTLVFTLEKANLPGSHIHT